MHNLTLHFAPGACSRVPLIALETLNVAFQTELVIFMQGAHKSPRFKQLNPSSKVPVLVVNAKPLSQNMAILTWLDSAYPEAKLLPKTTTAMEKAQLLSLLAKFPSDFHPLVSRIRVPHFFCDIQGGPENVYSKAVKTMREQLKPIEDTLGEQAWLTGEHWSVIDAYLHWVWFRITGAGFDPSDFPNISAHYAETLKQPAVQSAIAKENKAQAFLESKGLSPTFLKAKSSQN